MGNCRKIRRFLGRHLPMASWHRSTGWQRETNMPMQRSAAHRCFLTRDEQEEYERLAAWYLDWDPPAEGYPLSPGVEVLNPMLNHAYYCGAIRAGCAGQVQRHLLWWLRKHWELFGGPKS